MANHHRGDVDLKLASGMLPLRLTLGALAEIETAFGVTGLAALGERMQQGNLGARDMIALLGAAARGAGARLDDDDIARRIGVADMPVCVEALVALFTATFGEGK
ncbi:MAG: gene transfer agent family protein [Proteobacteria bacterium]|nr:gene transfer agent family protein [Pseudomonadota bacterium]